MCMERLRASPRTVKCLFLLVLAQIVVFLFFALLNQTSVTRTTMQPFMEGNVLRTQRKESQHEVAPHELAQKNVAPHELAQHNVAQLEVAQHEVAQHNVATHDVGPHEVAQHNVAPHEVAQHNVAPQEVAPHEVAQHNVAPHEVAQHNVAPHEVVQHNVVPHEVVQHNVVPHEVAQHNVAPHEVVQYNVAPHEIASHGEGQPEVVQREARLTQQMINVSSAISRLSNWTKWTESYEVPHQNTSDRFPAHMLQRQNTSEMKHMKQSNFQQLVQKGKKSRSGTRVKMDVIRTQPPNIDRKISFDLDFKLQNSTDYIYKNYQSSHPRIYSISYDTFKYFYTLPGSNTSCYIYGTNFILSIHMAKPKCVCSYSWHGKQCSVPDIVNQSFSFRYSPHNISVRSFPKRVINALIFNAEWELFEARICGLYHVIDVFLILESNYTMHGDPKPLRLLDKLKQGYLHGYQDKIVHVFLGDFAENGRTDGWVEDRYLRNFLGKQSLKQLTGYASEDIFLYTDADEIPSEETILFLKLHDGYSQPIGLSLRWSVFGFFWRNFEMTTVLAACSMALLRDVLHGNIYDVRTGEYAYKYKTELKRFYSVNESALSEWYIGDSLLYAGWHCSWCLSPDRIANKLVSAINADFPRWGDFPEKRELPYISKLIKTGVWFDDVTRFGALVSNHTDAYFAPPFVIGHWHRYQHILDINKAGIMP